MTALGKNRFRPTPVFRELRQRRLARLRLIASGDRELDIMVRDVSTHGLSAAASGTPPQIDEPVMVTLPDGRSYWGLVRWVERNVFGVEFDVSSES